MIPTLNLVVAILVATGLLTAISETVRWLLTGRGRQKIDQAKIVQGMALELLAPVHAELASARDSARDLRLELESVLAWAMVARALLDANRIEYPPVPDAVGRRQG